MTDKRDPSSMLDEQRALLRPLARRLARELPRELVDTIDRALRKAASTPVPPPRRGYASEKATADRITAPRERRK